METYGSAPADTGKGKSKLAFMTVWGLRETSGFIATQKHIIISKRSCRRFRVLKWSTALSLCHISLPILFKSITFFQTILRSDKMESKMKACDSTLQSAPLTVLSLPLQKIDTGYKCFSLVTFSVLRFLWNLASAMSILWGNFNQLLYLPNTTSGIQLLQMEQLRTTPSLVLVKENKPFCSLS